MHFTEWVESRILIDQTKHVNALLRFSFKDENVKLCNRFLAYNKEDGRIVHSQEEINDYILEEKKIKQLLNEKLSKILKEKIEEQNIAFGKEFKEKVDLIYKRLDNVDKKIKNKLSNINYFKNAVKWFLLDSLEFANFLNRQGLPVYYFFNSAWWGVINNSFDYKIQFDFFQKHKSLYIFNNVEIGQVIEFIQKPAPINHVDEMKIIPIWRQNNLHQLYNEIARKNLYQSKRPTESKKDKLIRISPSSPFYKYYEDRNLNE